MKQYPPFATEVSCLAFSPNGENLAVGVSYEHDNGVSQPDLMGKTALLIKTTVMDDCRVSTIESLTHAWILMNFLVLSPRQRLPRLYRFHSPKMIITALCLDWVLSSRASTG